MPVSRFSFLALLLLLPLWAIASPSEDVAGDAEAGRLLYQFGQLANGEELVGLGFGETEIRGDVAACVRCHRRSGFGSYEGGFYIPPITQPYLFGGRRISRDDRFRALFMQAQTAEFRHQVRRIRDRAPYDLPTLETALNDGVDPDGRAFEELMPRYRLGTTDVANLAAYLHSLSATISEGIGEQHVELATIVHRDVDAPRSEALVGTLESFSEWHNKRTLGDLRLAGHSVYGSSLYTQYSRLYRMHVWELDGPPETWRAQLEAHYRRQPVFAVISGLVDGPWAEIGAFSDEYGLPTIVPISDLPHTPGPLGGYTVYFNRGMLLESDLIAERLRGRAVSVLQRVGDSAAERAAAARLDEQVQGAAAMHRLDAAVDSASIEADVLVVWQRDPDPKQVERWWRDSGASEVFLPASALAEMQSAEGSDFRSALRFSWTHALEADAYPERFRARAWMNTRGLDYAAADVQYRAWYAMSMFRDSFVHLLDHYHRDFLLEVLEHQIQGSANPGLYPDMQLAPEQRFASRSGYIVELAPEQPGGVAALGARIIP
jgi:hypothetical protein